MNSRLLMRFLLIAGAVMVVLASTPYPLFDLSRFLAPKELVLNSVALALALLCLRQTKEMELDAVDLLLGVYLALSAVSALFARDLWLSTSALAVSLSGAAVFWGARSVAREGRNAIVTAVAVAAVFGAAASLAQAYGLSSDLFSLNRIPGGTMGNRNFMAHLSVICLPALVLVSFRLRRVWAFMCCALAMAVVADALVLARSRAALLGLGVGLAALAYGIWRARVRWSDAGVVLRLKVLSAAVVLGVLAALFIPNTLQWKSDSPYLDTVSGIVNYREGSGHGRLVQYGTTLRMSLSHPVFGAGPGNWPLVYPEFSEYFDPSMDYYTGLTINPWPSNDWLAILSERGVLALAAILLAFLALFSGAWRRVASAADAEQWQEGLALSCMLLIAGTVACFDAVLLLPASSFMAWALCGALAPQLPVLGVVNLSPRVRGRLMRVVFVLGCMAVLRSCGQVAAMSLATKARSVSQVAAAARLDPGNLNIRQRLAANGRSVKNEPGGLAGLLRKLRFSP